MGNRRQQCANTGRSGGRRILLADKRYSHRPYWSRSNTKTADADYFSLWPFAWNLLPNGLRSPPPEGFVWQDPQPSLVC